MAYAYHQFNTPYLWPYYQQQMLTPIIPAQASLPASPNAGSGTKHVRFDGDDQTPPPAKFHPFLDGEAPGGPLLLFDLSSTIFDPLRITNYGLGQGTALSRDELAQTATYPATTKMVISCDELLPQWNVTLEDCRDGRHSHNGYLAIPSSNNHTDAPITVYDVLFAIHRMLQRQVTHREWYDVPQDRSTAIARAYTRRCRAVPNIQAFEESQGVRRVDFLTDRVMFKGLVRSRGEQGFERVRLRVGKK
ncbi:hypothetical protein EIP86_000333 [Pleurotus ostreatoroseus]|nr:hypothetical protein EIP86_000333 [Pleurotus ostreatoroseus]